MVVMCLSQVSRALVYNPRYLPHGSALAGAREAFMRDATDGGTEVARILQPEDALDVFVPSGCGANGGRDECVLALEAEALPHAPPRAGEAAWPPRAAGHGGIPLSMCMQAVLNGQAIMVCYIHFGTRTHACRAYPSKRRLFPWTGHDGHVGSECAYFVCMNT